ncbi:IclR family transcriptional regulator [Marivita sp. S6314]|uniref:IclR family transcriptional regulator n=1 Tax=Marivita sp. S6314 TaxID=2926406 RepID=UPI001FF674CC|nr:IclR family transcriptional regulator [Marivita sp. S6314]MCK0150137.1 IclR family transcriptional regulator [Marivita sp. S6314]
MSANDPYIVPGLVRGLAALRSFTPERPEQGLPEIAKSLGITRSAAFRTIHTLVSEGYLLEVPGKSKYRLGPQVLGLSYGFLASRELLEVANKPLEALRDSIDWSTHLGVLDARHVLYLIRFPATDGLSSLVHVGSRLPAAQTAMGRLLLAHRTEREIRKALELRPKSELDAALANRAHDLQRETVVHQGQFESGLCSVAAPVRDMSGSVVAAVSATKYTQDLDEDVTRQTIAAAQAISRGLGAAV